MTWAHRPHGVRTRGKKIVEKTQQTGDRVGTGTVDRLGQGTGAGDLGQGTGGRELGQGTGDGGSKLRTGNWDRELGRKRTGNSKMGT